MHVSIFFNILIKWHAINFLELVMAFLFSSSSKSDFQKFMAWFSVFGAFIAVVIITLLVAKKWIPVYVERRVSALYDGIGYSRVGFYQLLYHSAFMIRRFMIIWVPAFLISSPSSKIMTITFINLAYILYYFGVSPHSGRSLQRLYRFNEFIVLSFTYVLILFTDFVQEPQTQYPLGYVIVTIVATAFIVNIVFNIWSSYQRALSKFRQTKNKKIFLQNMQNKSVKFSAHVEEYREIRSDLRSSSSSQGPASISSLSESSMTSQKNYLSMIREEPEQEDLTTHRHINIPGPTPAPLVVKPDPIPEAADDEENKPVVINTKAPALAAESVAPVQEKAEKLSFSMAGLNRFMTMTFSQSQK